MAVCVPPDDDAAAAPLWRVHNSPETPGPDFNLNFKL